MPLVRDLDRHHDEEQAAANAVASTIENVGFVARLGIAGVALAVASTPAAF